MLALCNNMFNNYSSNDCDVQLPPIREVSQPHAQRNDLPDLLTLQLSRASRRYDDLPEYPGRFRGWYSHAKPLSASPSPDLVPTAPASPVLLPYNVEESETRKASGAREDIIETTGRKDAESDSIRSKMEGMIVYHKVCSKNC
jgi:hypothetical protein